MFSRSRNPLLSADIPTELPCLSDLENLGQLPVQEVLRGTDDCVIDFYNFFNVYVFEVKKSIADISTELPCSGDLENPGQLPVHGVLKLSYRFLIFLKTINVLEGQ